MNISQFLPYYKRNLTLAFPVIISQIGQVTVAIADNMMVGHVGTNELAAAAFANNVFTIGLYFGMGITYGLTPLVGQTINNHVKTSEWLKNGFFSHSLVGIIILAFLISLYFFLPFFGQTENVLKLARPYYFWLCASFIPFLFFYSFKQFFEGIGNTKIAMFITLTANVINVIVNYVLIFGKYGLPQMGLNGAGIGTFTARFVMPVIFALVIYKTPRFFNIFKIASTCKLNKEKIRRVLKVGIPVGFQLVIELLAFSLGAIMMGWLGEVPLASHQVAIGLAYFTYMISLGVASATTIRVSHQLGKGDFQALKRATYASTHLVLFFMFLMAIIFILFNKFLPLLFTTDPEVILIASGLIVVAAFFQIFDGLQVVMLGALRGLADVKKPMVLSFFAYIVIGIPVSYTLTFVFNTGPKGIWLGFLVGLAAAGIMFFLRFKKLVSEMK
ncbi:MAG: MATE family efflux transporter [Prolixibacteraceae bacterium]|nr:MATE family efflux transporter [Prolixibacteraceae bacterium]MBN2775949.1 MATE family efflux transporter [Prolixibacteraceae bacterium]